MERAWRLAAPCAVLVSVVFVTVVGSASPEPELTLPTAPTDHAEPQCQAPGSLTPGQPREPLLPLHAPVTAHSMVATPPPTPRPASQPGLTRVEFGDLPEELLEGAPVDLGWRADGEVYSVALVASWTLTKLGNRDRGRQTVVVQEATPEPVGRASWRAPWVDGVAVDLTLKAFARDGSVVATARVTLPYRPAVLADRREDGVYVWLSGPRGQRLYLQRDGRLVLAAVCSGAAGATVVPAGRHPRYPHDHYGVFRVLSKRVDHYSSFNAAWRMRYALFFLSGHAIHATSPNMYRHLGRPASHGCVRLHLVDARALYGQVSRGTRVEVF